MTKINDNWFYSNTNKIFKVLGIFIKGDMLIILPFWLTVFLLGFINKELAVLLGLIYFGLRFMGEMIYWFLQQFSKQEYRPYDYGLKNLSNNSIYIIYQLFSLIMATIFLSLLIYFIFF